MCDYSLYVFPNRLARDGDELIAHRFSSGCTGFITVADIPERQSRWTWLGVNWPDLKTWFFPRQHDGPKAVCIPPGAQLRLEVVEFGLRQRLGLRETEQAIFIQVSAEEFSYRDGLRFRNDRQILLQGLPPGQRVSVISASGLSNETREPSVAEMSVDD